LLVFFARLAELRPVSSIVLTLLTGEPILQKVLSEIKRMPTSIAERIKWVFFIILTHFVACSDDDYKCLGHRGTKGVAGAAVGIHTHVQGTLGLS
jgi:hypothetical protein